jgi:hypothetical protein
VTRRLVRFRFQAKRLDFSGNMNKVLLDEVVWMEIVRLLEDPQLGGDSHRVYDVGCRRN